MACSRHCLIIAAHLIFYARQYCRRNDATRVACRFIISGRRDAAPQRYAQQTRACRGAAWRRGSAITLQLPAVSTVRFMPVGLPGLLIAHGISAELISLARVWLSRVVGSVAAWHLTLALFWRKRRLV